MQYFDIILFAVIAGVLAIRLYRILGIKSKVTIEKNEEAINKVINIKKEKEKEKRSRKGKCNNRKWRGTKLSQESTA